VTGQITATGKGVARLASNRADARCLVINYAKCTENLSDRVRRAFRNLFNNKANSVRNTRCGLSAMTRIAIPPELAGMFAACEEAYEQATREGYAENPIVIAAVTALKSAWRALHVANYNLITAKGFFSVEFAAIRSDRAYSARPSPAGAGCRCKPSWWTSCGPRSNKRSATMIEVVQAFDRAPITRLESDDAAALDRKNETAQRLSADGHAWPAFAFDTRRDAVVGRSFTPEA
jgi:hypothetical protein